MIEALLPLIGGAALLALAGMVHCVGMCGGIGTALTFAIPETRRRGARLWAWQLLFAGGRVGGYTLLGSLAGALGGQLLNLLPAGGPAWPALFSGLLMVLLAWHFLGNGGALRALERPGAALWRWLKPARAALIPVDRPYKALGLGLLWGLLPCGLVYSALLLAATAGGALAGAVANFPLQQTWTFGGRFRAGAVPGYAAACGFGWMMNGALFLLLHQTLALAVAPAQVLTTALVALSNYTLYKRWVFHDGSRSSG